MKIALALAEKSADLGEVPVGAVVVLKDKIIGCGLNLKEINRNSTHHAEILAINSACKQISSWRLLECDIYVTLEPCLMCMGAIINSRILRLIFAAKRDVKFGSNSHIDVLNASKLKILSGIMEKESLKLISDFFVNLRKNKI